MELLTRIQDNWIVLLIPAISALVGWFTNVVAIKMMFHPVEFVGIPPYLGWQGVIPANSVRLAKVSNTLITQKLLSLRQLFDQTFNADSFAGKLGAVIDDVTEQVIDEVANKHAKAMWDNAGEFMQNRVREQVRAEVIGVSRAIAMDMADDIDSIMDIERTVLEAMERHKGLMGEMFYEVGRKEFRFIERSGLYFGFLFGLFQMVIWVLYPAPWILPAAGFCVGYLTNWIAIKLVFAPREPIKIGPVTVQGLFHKRQNEVAEAFGRTVATRVLNADNIVTTVMEGDGATRMNEIIEHRIADLIAKYEAHPMATLVLPEDQRSTLRAELLDRIKTEWPKPGGFFHTFAGESVDLQGELERRMKSLDRESYEGVLRPAFQQDEWKLIAAGAILGTVAGVLQLVYIFGDAMERLSR
ncbi:MAG: DUF445 family protein [Deltaproteobacteria bacterium]|nr:DUF445 family protein [Deltaproteobacteria bacterium]MBW1875154.1 DUF445 family protein [Deltaproteobacteria bacterium]MBW2209758.1 DUF445 family protein [Deltaproteobacteria bacterium]MBW2213195.1 DUF445 family protein [Deltaproteobacteria bacterium]MBW2379146.1 DUF445 family protein [Deltaproteobacteria bacterium]